MRRYERVRQRAKKPLHIVDIYFLLQLQSRKNYHTCARTDTNWWSGLSFLASPLAHSALHPPEQFVRSISGPVAEHVSATHPHTEIIHICTTGWSVSSAPKCLYGFIIPSLNKHRHLQHTSRKCTANTDDVIIYYSVRLGAIAG